MSTVFHKLNERKEKGNLRALSDDLQLIDFSSNDYLGLGRSKALFDRISSYSYEGITQLNGSTGSRLLAGNTPQASALETKLAGIFKGEASLLFNSGYVANLALVSCIPQKEDTIIYDSLSHVCLKEGAWLSKAKTYSFVHNDAEDLEKKIKNAQGEKYVIIESVYSMDGDEAPFQEIIDIAKKYEAKIIIDEAHGTGVYGAHGSGKVCDLGIENEFFARVYTFGKAMGVHGACVVGSRELIAYLINFARPFIYTTALPIHSIFSIEAAFDYLSDHVDLQITSAQKIAQFNALFENKIGSSDQAYKLLSHSPIQPIIVSGNDRAKRVASALQNKGYDVRAILSPTVKAGAERLRINIHTYNTNEQIESLVDTLALLL